MKKYLLPIMLILCLIWSSTVFAVEDIHSIRIGEKNMRACIKGSGDRTIVMLSGFGTDNPIDDFIPLADKLCDKYRVVILEYFGYGLSDITEDERTNEMMVSEIRMALDELGIKPPYILMPHSMSGLYSLYYAKHYPTEVSGIVGIDMSLPQKQLERWTEDKFEEIKMSEKPGGPNISIVNQWNKFYDNSYELKDIKYPDNLPILALLASEQIEAVDEMIKSGHMKTPWLKINTNMITNPNIQKIEILEGSHYLHHEQLTNMSNTIKKFIEDKIESH